MILRKVTKINSKDIQDKPTIIFATEEQMLDIGKWLGEIPNEISSINILRWKNAEICHKIRKIFNLIGFEDKEVCVFSNYKKVQTDEQNKFSFDCHFNNENIEAKITMIKYNNLSSEIVVDYKNTIKVFRYHKELNGNIYFKPINYTITNVENKNVYYRSLGYYSTSFYVMNENKKFSVVANPNALPYDSHNYMVELDNEKELAKYLLDLSFPIDFIEECKKIFKISLNPVSDYLNIEIKLEEKKDRDFFNTTDLISITRGKVNNIIITKNGKTISIDSTGNWSYEYENLSASNNSGLNMTFNIHTDDTSLENSIPITPSEELNKINEEIEQIKKLARTMFKTNKN